VGPAALRRRLHTADVNPDRAHPREAAVDDSCTKRESSGGDSDVGLSPRDRAG